MIIQITNINLYITASFTQHQFQVSFQLLSSSLIMFDIINTQNMEETLPLREVVRPGHLLSPAFLKGHLIRGRLCCPLLASSRWCYPSALLVGTVRFCPIGRLHYLRVPSFLQLIDQRVPLCLDRGLSERQRSRSLLAFAWACSSSSDMRALCYLMIRSLY